MQQTPARWAYPLAQRGIKQALPLGKSHHGTMDVKGATLFHGWLHCPSATIDTFPSMPGPTASKEEWEKVTDEVDEFQQKFAFTREESGLGKSMTSKWQCPALKGRVGRPARGQESVATAIESGLPMLRPPADFALRDCCTQQTIDFTPSLDETSHQRKLAQAEYFLSTAWRRLYRGRARVEGVFGIIKNPGRERVQRGQARIGGIAWMTLVLAIKASVFNEHQLRAWHERTGLGPTDHPLLQPDPVDNGFAHLTQTQADAIDEMNLAEHQKRAA